MTTKKQSGIMTRKTGSEIGRQVSAYFAPNYHLCQNYTENGSVLSVHKSAQSSTIVECNRYHTSAIVTVPLQVLSRNRLRLFRGLNDCKHYLLHPSQATFYTYTKGNKMTEEELKKAMEATPEWAEHRRTIQSHEAGCEKQRTLETMANELSKAGADLWKARLKANDALFATKEHKAYWKLWKENN